uniref:D-aspartate oxidase n=1 Tax=Scleropages formosus TaxID=113540 RepID=A0A8C9WDG4_SCLFO
MNTARFLVAVVGAGVVGLSTAVVIAEALPHCSVTVLADRFTPNTTSDGAAGILFASQFPDVPVEQQRRWFKRTFDHLLLIASSPEAGVAGVFLSSGWQIFREVPPEKKPYWSDCVLSFGTMTDAELKRFPQYKFGQAFTTIKCECPSYLPWLQKRLEKAGGIMIHEKVTDLAELGLRYDVIVNCSGLGSRELLGDEDVHPVRGQVLRVHAPWLQHFVRVADGHTYIYPGAGGVTLGGTRQAADSQAIFERCRRLEPSLGSARPLGEWVGLRPGRRNPRVERGHVRVHGRRVPVVHNYGHGGWGITLSWGTALDALDLVRQCLNERPPEARL